MVGSHPGARLGMAWKVGSEFLDPRIQSFVLFYSIRQSYFFDSVLGIVAQCSILPYFYFIYGNLFDFTR
jgi:hypothetical protein